MSKTNGGASRKRKVPVAAIGPAEALEILKSAVSYCQQAGIPIEAGNVETGIVLVIGQAHIAIDGEGEPDFLPGNPTPELLAIAPGEGILA